MVQLYSAETEPYILYTSRVYHTLLSYILILYIIISRFILTLVMYTDLPRVSLELGKTLNANNIKEGDDVYFECSVKAKPKAYKIEWKFNVSTKNLNLTPKNLVI